MLPNLTMKTSILCYLFLMGLFYYPTQAQTTYTVNYTYDAQGRLTEAAYGSDMRIAYTYDANSNLLSKVTESPHGVALEEDALLPTEFALLSNYPNPFNPVTKLAFDLPETAQVHVEVFDLLGRAVLVVPAKHVRAGASRTVALDASSLASGTYFYRITAETDTQMMIDTGRMVLVK